MGEVPLYPDFISELGSSEIVFKLNTILTESESISRPATLKIRVDMLA